MSGFSNVLLIEDNPGDRRLVVEYLRERYGDDCTVREAGTLAAGLASLRRDGTDVVLLDLGLPDSVGLDSYFAVNSAAPTTPVVILTGDDDEDAAAQALHEGAEDYLAKRHADSVALIRAMRHAVHRRKAGARAAAFDPRCKALTEIVDDGIAQVDAQGVISFANAQLARLLLGRQDEPEAASTPEALIGCRLADHVLPADHPEIGRAHV